MYKKGAVAAGDGHTANAAAEVLRAGGNAFDAVLAALLAATQAEPVLASLGGGGFLLARPMGGDAQLYDFFVQTPHVNKARSSAPHNKARSSAPHNKARDSAPHNRDDEIDFHPVMADFGTVQQEFHIGQGSIATPGVVKGIFSIHEKLGHMPLSEIVEPAISLARGGLKLSPLQAYIFDVVSPIYTSNKSIMQLYASPENPDSLIGEGETIKNPDFADFLDALVHEGADLFYRGEVAKKISSDCNEMGGHLGMDDFEKYTVHQRLPLEVSYGDATILTNPPPSTGGILIGFALKLLEKIDLKKSGFGTAAHIEILTRVMGLTNQARIESALGQNENAGEMLLDPDFIKSYRENILTVPKSHRGTTHISVIDALGNAAALTVSNGEGSGYIAPGTGVVLNNMLGEEDINPRGFGAWDENTRMSSMMAPSILITNDGREYALGSGGSNRIRTALLQVISALQDFNVNLPDAVSLPRIHFEEGLLNIEPGFMDEAVDAVKTSFDNYKLWDDLNLFFGGVHGVMFDPKNKTLTAAGDPRRGGADIII
ncbi:MAG: gamma-glutamyltransferase [Rhodospirillaceae bacterium]|nr:gamma-glutamyltransferase [Rhodospirillaceae bacterium]